MGPTLDKSVSAKHLFQLCCGRSFEPKELDIVAWISLVNRDDVGCIVIEGGQPFLLLFGWPIGLDRRDIIIGFGPFGLEWSGRIHGSKTGRAQKLRSLRHFGPHWRWQRDDFVVDQKLPDHFHVARGIWN